MADAQLNDLAQNLLNKGSMSEDELLTFRRMTGKDFNISSEEADILFKVNDDVKTPEGWSEYFINAITHFLLHQSEPQGYVTEANAAWLRQRIDHDGVVESETELNLLLSLLKIAKNVTDSLEKFALEQVGQAVISGKGYIGKNRQLKPGVIGETEIDILRRVLYAVSGDQGISISQTEAKFLFDLNEKTLGAENHADWQDLFVKGITNHLMMKTAFNEPSKQEVLRQYKWLENREPSISLGDILRNFFKPKADEALADAALSESDLAIETFNNEASLIEEAEKITSSEASWLIERLNRDGQLDANETALLEFLQEECPDIHASLKSLIKTA